MSERTIVFKYNVDPSGNPISVKIKEIAQVSPLKHMIQLEQLPDELYGVTLLNEDNSMMKQVYKYEEVDKNPNSYYVNYTNGLIYFNSTQGTEKKVINYYGTGMELISAKRIFDEYYRADGTLVQQTLQELIDEGREAIELLGQVGGASVVIQILLEKIEEGSVLAEELTELKQELTEAINVTGNEVVNISEGDWVYNSTDEIYEYTITHTMNSTNLIINCYNNDTNEFVFCTGKIIDASNVLIQLEEDINLKVVLNARYYKASDFDYITEDLADELQDAIDEAKDAINVTGNEVVNISEGDWVYNPTNKMYEYTINHTMNSKDLIIDCYNLATGDFVLCGGKIVNNNSVLIKSETNIDLKVVLNARYYKATLTISDDIAREVVDARKGHATVGDRLDNLGDTIDSIYSKINDIPNNINVIDDNLIKVDSTWSSHKINNTITRLQTGFKIPIVTEQPNNPSDGEMWILKTIINDGSDESVLLHNEFNKSGDVNLGAISNLGHKTAIGITPTYSFKLTNLKIKATTRGSNIHNSKMSIKIELCRVSNGQPSTVLETQYAESPSTSETIFAIESTFNSELMQGTEYCIVLSTTTTSTCYVSIRGSVVNAFDFIYGLNYANTNETWSWKKHPEQEANFNMFGIKL